MRSMFPIDGNRCSSASSKRSFASIAVADVLRGLGSLLKLTFFLGNLGLSLVLDMMVGLSRLVLGALATIASTLPSVWSSSSDVSESDDNPGMSLNAVCIGVLTLPAAGSAP